ncbi:hypothetical protein QWZ02_07255 [Kinneretia asaccharophila]|uniref:hypothetical protein n=1 Tax=Roseateles asaccharophilus TaxID=582607 RepID=UPI00105B4DDB|nr:hypothetical protein [Roseateles asaccharophilus]MDN3544244.1 hypothetical protein [Roseateles asaccharophilus]
MNHQQVNGIDLYNFQKDNDRSELLFWMGESCAEFIVNSVIHQVCSQVADSELLGIKAHSDPVFQVRVATKRGNKVSYIEAKFPMQVLIRNPQGDIRLEVTGTYEYRANLDGSRPPEITKSFDISHQTWL